MNRGDAETLSKTDQGLVCRRPGLRISFLLLALSLCVSAVNLCCGSKPSDLRTLVPADTLIYLETNDLGAAVQPIIDSKPFTDAAKYKPDLSPIKGVQLAVAVTGFEMAEEKVSDEQSVGSIRPHFVAVADTHAWNWQAVAFAEEKLGGFVARIYDSEPEVVRSDKFGGSYFTWTAKDRRKAYALVLDGLIYFGNDESSIEKCLAVRRGESDSLGKSGKVPAAEPETLASGYVGPDGIAQLANVIGLKLAAEASDESEVQTAVASVVPQLLRHAITEINWSVRYSDTGIEDRYTVSLRQEVAGPLATAMTPRGQVFLEHEQDVSDLPEATLYSLRSPLLAWQTAISIAQQQTDPVSGRIIGELSPVLLSSYGIRDADRFLERVDGYIITAHVDDLDDNGVLVAWASVNTSPSSPSLASLCEQNVKLAPEGNFDIYASEDGELKAAFGSSIILGDSDGVSKWILRSSRFKETQDKKSRYLAFDKDYPSILSFGRDHGAAVQIANTLAGARASIDRATSSYTTETKFTPEGVERRTVSDFGLIGSIIGQLSEE